eukprot:143834_1
MCADNNMLSEIGNGTLTRAFEMLGNNALNVIVFYRGKWCPACNKWVPCINNELERLVRKSNGQMLFVSAFTQDEVDKQLKVAEEWKLDFDIIGDPENVLADYLRTQKIMNVAFGSRTTYGE